MQTETVNDEKQIFLEKIETFTKNKNEVQNLLDNANKNLERIKAGETLDIDAPRLRNLIKRLRSLRKSRVNLWLLSKAKLTTYDDSITAIIGDYSKWKENATEAEAMLSVLTDTIALDNDLYKVYKETLSLLNEEK